ncbi:unnamed protein product [Prunus brigantina]
MMFFGMRKLPVTNIPKQNVWHCIIPVALRPILDLFCLIQSRRGAAKKSPEVGEHKHFLDNLLCLQVLIHNHFQNQIKHLPKINTLVGLPEACPHHKLAHGLEIITLY